MCVCVCVCVCVCAHLCVFLQQPRLIPCLHIDQSWPSTAKVHQHTLVLVPSVRCVCVAYVSLLYV